jgi:hypothetical protein
MKNENENWRNKSADLVDRVAIFVAVGVVPKPYVYKKRWVGSPKI